MPKKKTLTNKVTKLTKKVNQIAKNFETKFHYEQATGTTTYYNTAAVSTLFDPAQGDSAYERVGDSCQPFRIKINGMFTQESGTAGTTCARVMLIQSKQRFVPTSHDSADSSGVWLRGGTAAAVFSPLDDDNRSHYTVLYDRTFVIGRRDTSSISNVKFTINKKLSRKTQWTPGGVTAEKGQLYLIFTSDEASAGGLGPTRRWESTIMYKDA